VKKKKKKINISVSWGQYVRFLIRASKLHLVHASLAFCLLLQAVRIFAGARQNRRGDVYPTGTVRLCNWKPDPNQPPADEFASFGAYQRTLTLECEQGEPGLVQWTPDKNTPDTVYYQVQ
jgi:hypothetical protein